MSKRILLISGNFYPEPTGIGKYTGEMADWLSENGYNCTVITTFPYYPDWKVQSSYEKSRFWFKKEIKHPKSSNSLPIVIVRCPHYIPTSPTGFKRLLSEFTISFSCYVALFFLFFSRKFDYVFTVAPPFELGLLGVLYKKIRGAIIVYHIQDLQIDAARELGMIKSRFVLNLFSGLEKFIIKNSNHVSTISEGMRKKILVKGERHVAYFPNWVKMELFYPIWDKTNLKIQYGFNPADKIILYSGAIGEKQGLKAILQVAKRFEKFENVKFIISGSGPYKEQLVHLKHTLNSKNVIFLPLQPSEKFNTFLNMADLHLILQKSKGSDLFLPSKLSTILAVGGIAIVTAKPGTALYEIMNSSDMGFIIEPDDEDKLALAIENALTSATQIKSNNARAYAENNLSIDTVLTQFKLNILMESKGLKQDESSRNNPALSN